MIKMLPAEYVISHFIKNMPECDYELYLLECINQSSYFMTKTGGTAFVLQGPQSHGECDCYANEKMQYGLDFKLFTSEKALHANSIFSLQVEQLAPGAYVYSVPKKERGQITATWITKVLNGLSLYELEQVARGENSTKLNNTANEDVRQVLLKLETSKNLFFFLTNYFYFQDDNYDYQEEVGDIVSTLSKQLEGIVLYRKKHSGNFDTFFSFIFDKKLVITQFEETGLVLVDFVELSKSETFMRIDSTLDPMRSVMWSKENKRKNNETITGSEGIR